MQLAALIPAQVALYAYPSFGFLQLAGSRSLAQHSFKRAVRWFFISLPPAMQADGCGHMDLCSRQHMCACTR